MRGEPGEGETVCGEWFVHWELVLEATSCRVPQKVWWLGALFSLRVQKEKEEREEGELEDRRKSAARGRCACVR